MQMRALDLNRGEFSARKGASSIESSRLTRRRAEQSKQKEAAAAKTGDRPPLLADRASSRPFGSSVLAARGSLAGSRRVLDTYPTSCFSLE